MICYALACERGHSFESWFQNSAAYDTQAKRRLVSCPVCGSAKVDKAIMSPRITSVAKGRAAPVEVPAPTVEKTPVAMISPAEQEFRQKLREVREHLTKNADNVGAKFPEQARKMHYGEIEHRSIYGEASPKEAKDLAEEGVEFHPLPVLPDEHN
jgi:hypothetical protein